MIDDDKQYTDYRVISKIIKFDENNQYGFAMTKPMPIGTIKKTHRGLFNEIFPPFTEKQSRVEANERSVYQLLELYSEDGKGKPKSYKVSSKSHPNLLPKECIPLYLEEIKFAILRCGWKVSRLYKHYYFEQERFKRDFILMNQKSRQQVSNKIKSDFF